MTIRLLLLYFVFLSITYKNRSAVGTFSSRRLCFSHCIKRHAVAVVRSGSVVALNQSKSREYAVILRISPGVAAVVL